MSLVEVIDWILLCASCLIARDMFLRTLSLKPWRHCATLSPNSHQLDCIWLEWRCIFWLLRQFMQSKALPNVLRQAHLLCRCWR